MTPFSILVVLINITIFVCLTTTTFVTATTLSSSQSYIRFLESNTYIFKLGDIKIFSDPVMSQLDFGIPIVYRGNKRFIDGPKELSEEAATSDLVLISQGYDDHAHTPTLKKLAKLQPEMPYICSPSAVSILTSCGIRPNRITTIAHGQKLEFSKKGRKTVVDIRATQGALLGPPWQTKENGYILSPNVKSQIKFPSLYYEPHCMFDENELRAYAGKVDYVVTPVVAQKLPAFTLVDGGARALELVNLLGAKYVIPMMNGELDQAGLLSLLVRKSGSVEEFKRVAAAARKEIQIVEASPGEEVLLSSPSRTKMFT